MPCASIWRCSTMPRSAARRRSCPSSSRLPIRPSRWTGANGGPAFFAYSTNYLIDLKHAVIMDVEATTAVRQAEVTAQRVMLDRTQERFGIWPERLAADTGLWRCREPRLAGPRARHRAAHPGVREVTAPMAASGAADFTYDHEDDSYTCPGGNRLRATGRRRAAKAKPPPRMASTYRASKTDCDGCALQPRCRPNSRPARCRARSMKAPATGPRLRMTDAYLTSRRERKKVEMLFAHLKRILKLDRLRLRGPNGARDEFLLAAAAQNLRKLAKLIPWTAQAVTA